MAFGLIPYFVLNICIARNSLYDYTFQGVASWTPIQSPALVYTLVDCKCNVEIPVLHFLFDFPVLLQIFGRLLHPSRQPRLSLICGSSQESRHSLSHQAPQEISSQIRPKSILDILPKISNIRVPQEQVPWPIVGYLVDA